MTVTTKLKEHEIDAPIMNVLLWTLELQVKELYPRRIKQSHCKHIIFSFFFFFFFFFFALFFSDHTLEVTTGTAVIIECMLSIFIFMAYLQSNLDPKSKQVTGPLAYGFAVVVSILTA